MSALIAIILVVTSFLALYWAFYGQRKYNEMLNPKRKTELKAIIFDLDGVIINSFDAWLHVFNKTRRHFKLKELTKEEFRRKAWGKILDTELKKNFPDKNIKEIKDQYKALIAKSIDKIKLLPGSKDVLLEIKKKNIRIGLVTNNFRKPVKKILELHKIGKYFDAIVAEEDVEMPKPYPDGILKACKKLNVQPDEIIYVGDRENDYKAGKAAGAFVVGLNTKGDLIISQLKDLLQLL